MIHEYTILVFIIKFYALSDGLIEGILQTLQAFYSILSHLIENAARLSSFGFYIISIKNWNQPQKGKRTNEGICDCMEYCNISPSLYNQKSGLTLILQYFTFPFYLFCLF